MPNSIIEISQKAIKNNITYIKSLLNDQTTMSCVLKGNAYGHGISVMVPALQKVGIHHFSVFNSLEARQVFNNAKGEFTIMVMGDISDEDAHWMIENHIEFYTFNLQRIQNMLEIAKTKNTPLNIHLEIETGMNRTGFNKSDWQELIHIIKNNRKYINVKGICTHYAGAESVSNYVRVKLQRNIFKKAIKYFKNEGIQPERIHSSCSAAILAFPEDNFDMVRIGILHYGLWPSRETFISHMTKHNLEYSPLKPILSWTSYIMDIKHVNKGEYIGYGNSYLAENNMTIASVPIGYGYGYSRSLSNQGRVIVNNNRFSVIGIVNMNMLLIDITADQNVAINDNVILIGKQGDHEITVSSFGNMTDQLNYEVLSRIDKDIPRILK
ncbi:alanine racemase [Mangrovimonas spongiae]|uniref:Alanine racemase n=1 Tax=Mangrovimonas spongiae TaxID=2494697 RepID=A0A3R9NXM7_9FLAO|nr:alanine racemase [Mangrovimonas spongiae]RSK39837.1 alanine racemase [Mangrovimonas spongiae]